MSNLSHSSRGSSNGDRGGFTDVQETVMFEASRSRDGKTVVRFTFTKAISPDGKPVAWHSYREFFRAEDGSWRPTSKGITIKGAELRGVRDALIKACGGQAQ